MKSFIAAGVIAFLTSGSIAVGAEPSPSSEAVVADQERPSDWKYFVQTDGMSDKEISVAQTTSTNTFEFDFPYQGPQRARLALFNNPQHGLLALLVIERGQFFCDRGDDCAVRIRADEGPIKTFKISAPADRGTTGRFIENPKALSKLLVNAKKLRVEATFFHQGSRVFEFAVDGFRPKLK